MPRRGTTNRRPPTKRTGWQDLLSEFILLKRAEGMARRTLDDYECHITWFFLRFPVGLEDYEALRRSLLTYLAEPVAPGTRNIRLNNLKAFFNWCVASGYLPENPAAGIKKAKDEGNIRHVPPEDIQKLLKQPNRKTYVGLRDYCMLLLQVDTGIRPGEMCQMLPNDVNLEAREVYVRPGVAKTRTGRTLPISPLTADALRQLMKARPKWWSEKTPLFASEYGNPLSSWWWCKRFKQYSDRAGVEDHPIPCAILQP